LRLDLAPHEVGVDGVAAVAEGAQKVVAAQVSRPAQAMNPQTPPRTLSAGSQMSTAKRAAVAGMSCIRPTAPLGET